MIPKIRIAPFRAKGLTEGTLEFSFEADAAWLDLPLVSFSSPVRAELSYAIGADDSVEVCGRIAFRLVGSCSRCLSSAEEELESEVAAVFVDGEADEDAGEIAYANGLVELDDWLRECVIFSVPAVLHCETCKRQDL